MTNAMILILIVNFPLLDGDDPRAPSYGVYISQLIRLAGHLGALNARQTLTAKLLQKEYRYHKLRKVFFQNFIVDNTN